MNKHHSEKTRKKETVRRERKKKRKYVSQNLSKSEHHNNTCVSPEVGLTSGRQTSPAFPRWSARLAPPWACAMRSIALSGSLFRCCCLLFCCCCLLLFVVWCCLLLLLKWVCVWMCVCVCVFGSGMWRCQFGSCFVVVHIVSCR